MPPATLLGIDLGTSSVKVALVDAAGAVLQQADEPYAVDRPHPGWAETDPDAWWAAVRRACAQVLRAAPGAEVAGVGLSGQMHGVVLCDADLRPVRPAVLWADTRALAQLDAYRALPDATRRRLGNPVTAGMAGPSLAWLQQHEPAVVARAAWALQPKDWLRARMTGVVATEPSDASATLLLDVVDVRWSGEVLDALHVDRRLLPELLPWSGARAGDLLASAAADLGLPAGAPVAAGAADTAAAALGTGLVAPGAVQLTIGTGVQVVATVGAPALETLPTAPVTHLYRSATLDGWYAMAAGLTGGQTLDWVRRLLGAGWAELYDTATTPARAVDPLFLPHLVGERTPHLDPSMRGAWTGLDPRHDRTSLLRSALEGVAFAVADAVDALPLTAARGRETRLAGGGTTHAAWRTLLATVLDRPLHAVEVPA
ncbi:xylulokinase, partial [Angustibacter aerolatus]